ncbi:hypothetical protein [Kocuria sp.]|uniref:hypothetical protein n=1 Tax=Kocuria sp. TaxID=1871328 RepID=UPI0026E0B994|nr:hypothetical protein [Kocuria sp.]MDO5618023.1 hypothetical protein [Kocuria sp.]
MTLQSARDLVAIAQAHLSDAVLVTVDADQANAAVGQGSPVVLIQPPTIAHETYNDTTATWTVIVIAGEASLLDAWAQLDDIGEALRLPLDVDRAEPANFQPPQGRAWPALSLTSTTHHHHD